jgi:D-alanyl-D-alanine carboxypeptidase
MMNQEAKRVGMVNTHFINSTGMPADGHYSTAKDMAVLAQHIIKDSSNITQFILKKNLHLTVSNKVTVMPFFIQTQV